LGVKIGEVKRKGKETTTKRKDRYRDTKEDRGRESRSKWKKINF
jgi:hypothetical protein